MKLPKEELEKCATKESFFALIISAAGGLEKASELLDVSQSYLSQLRSGKRKPSPEMALRIELKLNSQLRAAWLLWGRK